MRFLTLISILLIALFSIAGLKETEKQDITSEINLIQNGGFENGLAGWSVSGGTLNQDLATPLSGASSAIWDASAPAQAFLSPLVAIAEGMKNRTCSIQGLYKWDSGVKGDLVLEAWDGSLVIASYDIDPTSGSAQSLVSPFFTCPSSGSLAIRISSTADAASIELDGLYLGSGRNTFQVSQSEVFGEISADGSCLWTSTSGTYADFSVDGSCGIVSTQNANVVSGLPHINFNYIPAGKYTITAVSFFDTDNAGTSTTCRYDIVDENDVSGDLNATSSSIGDPDQQNTGASSMSLEESFSYTTGQSNKTFKVRGLRAGGTSTCRMGFANGLVLRVVRYPLNAAEAVTLETSGEYWDVNIGGGLADLGVVAVSSYVELVNPNLDLVVNAGSKNAEIPCDTTNPSTGLTCAAGNEGIGIVIDITTAGMYQVCSEFSYFSQVDAAESLQAIFEWVETPNNAQTILQRGKSRTIAASRAGSTAGSNQQLGVPYNLCGTFNFATTGQKTLRLMYEQVVVGTPTISQIVADRSASLGDRDIHVIVRKMDQQMPTPIFTDLQNSLAKKVETAGQTADQTIIFGAAIIDSAGTPTLSREYGDWVDSISDLGVGNPSVNIDAGKVADYTCTCSTRSLNFACAVTSTGSTGTAVSILTWNSATDTAADRDVHLTCIGRRP